jgi:hypothetical protein
MIFGRRATVGSLGRIFANMQNVKETQRHPSPGARPQPLAVHGGHLWVGSWETEKLYAIDPKSWSVATEFAAPGRPYGIAPFQGGLSVVVAIGDDDRYLYRCDPQRGFDPGSGIACPDFTGSHLAADDRALYLCQQGNRRILVLNAAGAVQREVSLPARCAGFGFGPGGESFMISGDEEFENLELARLNLDESAPSARPVAAIPFDARALAFDGTQWWTSHRDANEIVAFTT